MESASDNVYKKIGIQTLKVTTIILLALSAGCALLVPSIFYPQTQVHGVVLDQNDTPLVNVRIEVTKEWPMSSLLYPSSPSSAWYIRSDEEGLWRVSARKVGRLFVEALPPQGYKTSDTERLEMAGPLYSGNCPTNKFVVLRLMKIDDELPPKE